MKLRLLVLLVTILIKKSISQRNRGSGFPLFDDVATLVDRVLDNPLSRQSISRQDSSVIDELLSAGESNTVDISKCIR